NYVPGVTQENFDKVYALYHANAFVALLGAAFTPIPFKVFTIAAGVFDVSLVVLLVASSIGRFARFMLVAAFIYKFGPGVKALIEKYFELVTLAFFALLVLGFLAIRYFM
ncbi:MAG: YqaA family protein, partial [Thermoguttaceae bacterium]